MLTSLIEELGELPNKNNGHMAVNIKQQWKRAVADARDEVSESEIAVFLLTSGFSLLSDDDVRQFRDLAKKGHASYIKHTAPSAFGKLLAESGGIL